MHKVEAATGRLLRGIRAGAHRSRLSEFDLPSSITVASDAFDDGGAIPARYAGRGVGDNESPPLRWSQIPHGTATLVLVIEDDDVPLPRPLTHTIAVIEPDVDHVDEGALHPSNTEIRFIPTLLGRGYFGPRPIPGHGWHHYRFHLFALSDPVPDRITSRRELLHAMRAHATARGVLTGVYQRR